MVAPSITGVAPSSGTEIEPGEPLYLEVLHNGTPLLRVIIALQFPGMEMWEVVYDGTEFVERYAGLSTTAAVAGGTSFLFRRAPVWPDGPRLKVWAINTAGEETTSLTLYWTLPATAPAPSGSVVPVFPTGPGPGPGACNAIALPQDYFLRMFDRFFASEWVRPLRDRGDGFGYELLQAFAAIGARCSTAVERLECGNFAIFAEGGAKATGVVEFLRPTATAGAVTVKAGSLVRTSKNGRVFRTLESAVFGVSDLGPVAVPVEAIDVGEEYNVKGQVITPSGITLPGEIDAIFRMFQLNASGIDDWIDASITVRQVLDVSGGRSPWLDALGQDRGVYRGHGEPDDVYRYRIRSLPDNLTPAAIRRALDALRDTWGVEYEFHEVWGGNYQTCFDYPSPNAGVPNELSPYPAELVANENVFTYDDPRDAYPPFQNRWLDDVEARGAFIVVVKQPACIAEYGMHYDSTDVVAADRQTLNGAVPGFFAISAYDLPADLPPDAGVGGCYDGFDPGMSGFWQAWWQTLQALKPAGVIAILELAGQ